MPLNLDRLGQRVIGTLIEKGLTVPESYPLTLNALVAGCNQKSNRDPKMQVEDYELEGALRKLMDDEWVIRRERAGSRTMRYSHAAKTQLGVERGELAILCELLCRGPQAPGALKTRIQRMHHVDSVDEVVDLLRGMASRPVPYVVELPKRPREKACRWMHLLDGSTPDDARSAAPQAETTSASPVTSTPAPPAPSPDELDALKQRLDELEERVRHLENRE